MDVRQSLVMAIRNLCANKLRFLHSMLGMIIGIAGFILALSSGNISLIYVQSQGNEFATGLMKMIVHTNVDLPIRITVADMKQLVEDNPDVISGVSPYIEADFPGGVRYGEKTEDEAQVYGVDSSYFDMVPVLNLQEGRFFNDMDIDRERKVCIIGKDIANNLVEGNALGKELRIWGIDYTVVGVLSEVQNSNLRNVEVFIPYTNAKKIFNDNISHNTYDDNYYVASNGKENMYDTQVIVREMLKERTGREYRNGWFLTVLAMDESTDMIKGYVIGGIIQWMLFASMVLIIGGVGIMNVMLASVQARTKEIGIRKAFGATKKNIQWQFCIEAIIISIIGGLIGVIVGFTMCYIICLYGEIPLKFLSLSVLPSLAAFGVMVLIGLIFGTYPAQQAAKMEIVDAINSD